MQKLIVGIVALTLTGCGMKSIDEQTKKSPNSIVGKTTQNVTEFDPKAGANVSDSKVRADVTNPVTAPVMAPAMPVTAGLSLAAAIISGVNRPAASAARPKPPCRGC